MCRPTVRDRQRTSVRPVSLARQSWGVRSNVGSVACFPLLVSPSRGATPPSLRRRVRGSGSPSHGTGILEQGRADPLSQEEQAQDDRTTCGCRPSWQEPRAPAPGTHDLTCRDGRTAGHPAVRPLTLFFIEGFIFLS